MKIVNRKGKIIKKEVSSKNQKFLYYNLEKNFLKRFFLKVLTSKIISFIFGLYAKTPFSKLHIKKIIKQNKIDLNLFEKQKFFSYNDFFIRKYKKINFEKNNKIFISPCESNLSFYKIKKNDVYHIKNNIYSLNNLLKNKKLAEEYKNDYCLIFRLEPSDYHRYIFIDNGIFKHQAVKIKGKFHTVNPIAFKKFNVFCENYREYNVLFTKNFGKIIQIEVGGLFVGKIFNHPYKSFKKGQEKGFFAFGGSTIILLIKKNIVKFDDIFFKNTLNKCETKINIGEAIGEKRYSK
ncbi:Phosphatidylserine decarboxylase proenzyme [Candidatus Phytoplasma mali]|uniref:Phosphatidylserine decarboxylase proenzyme n=1 Tax=Phytoplasma mali (strain AT) TaxID=482235 RepID=B3R071_PHYMT|nr:phosphatidylserine decarboxylase [Candidatus Phytoplasma mali]CAP18235.1 Phosphatidylserine decarboxylase proenzyme [Candidatus Phytoplasma mali]